MTPQPIESQIDKLRQLVKRDPRRAGLLGGLALVMCLLWGRLLFSGPASAAASLIHRAVATSADPTSGQIHGALSNPVMDWLAQPRRAVQRNLFSINLDFYARAGAPRTNSDGNDETDKPRPDEAEQQRQQQIMAENLKTQAGKLKLQSTLMGQSPAALVNGELVKQGDTVDGFVIVKIEAQRIVVQQNGVEVSIEMP